LLHTVFPQPLEEIDAELSRSGYWEGELVHQRRDGTTVTVSSRWAQSSDPGEAPKILESNRDISKRKEEEQKFRGLVEAAPDAVVIVNDQGRILIVNSQTERMFGYARNEMLDQKVEMLLPFAVCFCSAHARCSRARQRNPAERVASRSRCSAPADRRTAAHRA
jgi:PAS domain-containing protein